jgi:ATP-dependent DNA ligase
MSASEVASVTLPASGLIEPRIPSPKRAPTSADWIYELKIDGYRLMVRRLYDKVRIYSRRGADFTSLFNFEGSCTCTSGSDLAAFF